MKSKFLVAASTFAVLGFAVSASASIVLFEQFDYVDGPLLGTGGWVSSSGTASTLLVASGQAVLKEDGSAPEDLNKSFPNSAGDMYFGADFTVDDLGTPYVGTDNEYFIHFKDTGFNFSARVDIVAAAGGGDFSVGLGTDESTADVTWATDLTYATTYRLVVKYDQVINQAEMWINPVSAASTSALGEDRPFAGDVVSAIGIRESFSSAGETVRVDNIVVGTTFGDVLVPEPASLALMGLGGLAMLRRKA